eukprot:scaffold8032_cov136-Isochrysis_galbana.AAC.1
MQQIGWQMVRASDARTLEQYQPAVQLCHEGFLRSGRSHAAAQRALHLRATCAEGVQRAVSRRGFRMARDGHSKRWRHAYRLFITSEILVREMCSEGGQVALSSWACGS